MCGFFFKNINLLSWYHSLFNLLLQVWRFSTAFSPVSSWGFTDVPSMSVHLKKCHFNVVEQKTEPVPLPAMCTARDGLSLRRVLRHVNT